MQGRARKRTGKAAQRRAKTVARPPGTKPASAGASRVAGRAAASARFVRDLLVRGEAAKVTKGGKLPLRATHVIVKEKAGGAVEVRRARFRAF